MKNSFDDSFGDYNKRIESIIDDKEIRERSYKTRGPAGRFKIDKSKEWKPVEYPGYTIITPTFEDEVDNIKTYTRLGDIQHILLERLTLSKYAPAPITVLHLTIAELVAGSSYEKRVSGISEQNLLQVLFSVFNQLTLPGLIQMEVRGVSLFTRGFVIAVVTAADNNGYDNLIRFRNAIYDEEQLRSFGIKRKFKFTGHITLAYIEEELNTDDQDRLAETLININQRFFINSLSLNIVRAEVRKFDNMVRFYRQGGWPVFEFM